MNDEVFKSLITFEDLENVFSNKLLGVVKTDVVKGRSIRDRVVSVHVRVGIETVCATVAREAIVG